MCKADTCCFWFIGSNILYMIFILTGWILVLSTLPFLIPFDFYHPGARLAGFILILIGLFIFFHMILTMCIGDIFECCLKNRPFRKSSLEV